MSAWRWMTARRRSLASGAVVSTAAAGVLFAIVTAEGYPAADVTMNDAGVWVTSQQALRLGRFNRQVDQLDAGLAAMSGRNFDVVQDGSTVVMIDRDGRGMTSVDPARLTSSARVALPASATIAAGGDTSALLDSAQGLLWVRPGDGAAFVEAAKKKEGLEVGTRSSVAVGVDGSAAVASAAARRLTVVRRSGEVTRTELDVATGAQLSVTFVGAVPVVLDASTSRLITPDAVVPLPSIGGHPTLQQSGPEADSVLLSTDSALYTVGLGDDATPVPVAGGTGAPTAPVRLGTCAHAAWSTRATYVLACDGQAPRTQTVPLAPQQTSADLRLRVNRGQIVLNDVASGSVWLLTDPLKQVANWDDMLRQEKRTDKRTQDRRQEDEQPQRQRRRGVNHPPVAKPDALGVRPGGSVIVPVLDNDSDPDGDVLALAGVPRIDSAVGHLDLVANGQALQFTVAPGVTGAVRFRYRVSDGRGGSAEADVTATVHPDGENSPPQPKPGARTDVTVELGKSVQHGVLADWEDPDGDPLVLTGASIATQDTVRWTAAGLVTFVDAGVSPGTKKIKITVSDGRVDAAGELVVKVRPAGNLAPDVRDDLFVARAGQQTTLRPLLNDSDPNGDDLRLVEVKAPAGVEAVPDLDHGTISFTAARPGTVILDYKASDGPHAVPAQIRVDVSDVSGNTPPVAVGDALTVPEAGSGMVDVVANDLDLDGDVLAVRSVSVPANSGIRVSVLDLHVLQVEDDRALTAPVVVGYEVSDGMATARGSLTVRTSTGSAVNQPPLVRDDHAVVRAGDILTIPVLRNDSDPDGDRLALAPQVGDAGADRGLLFVDGDVLRYQAPTRPTTLSSVYTAVDSRGARASGQVTINVRGADPRRNQPPAPVTVEGRVFTGSTVFVKIPLDGIDPDGDSVTLMGVASAPSHGTVRQVKDGDTLVYEAFDALGSGGTDTFTYQVEDSLGARATATVRIGVVPRPSVNQAPVATDDLLRVRPGTPVAVPVLANDTDPDGDTIGLDPTTPFRAPPGLAVSVAGDRLAFTSPAQAGASTITYTISDGRGGRDSGFLTVQTDPQAPLLPPVARDDVVPDLSTARQEAGGQVVSVDVRANDDDPDGVREDLKVALVGPNAAAGRVDGGSVTIRLTDRPQAVAYRVTDVTGLTATAFVRVPGLVDQPPRLRPDALLTLTAGQRKVVHLADYVVDPEGRTVRLTSQSKVSATGADLSGALVVDETTLGFTAAKGYVGPGALTFEVTDGSSAQDPKGRTAVLTLPVQVLAPDNTPPQFVPTTLEVTPGEAPLTVGLEEFVRDRDAADAGNHTFSHLAAVPDGFTASLSGSTLKVAAATKVPRGTVARLQLDVSDGHSAPVQGVVAVRVAASTRPLARANDDTVTAADQGKPVTIAVLANDANPFPDQPLTVASARLAAGAGSVEVRAGRDVVFTPAADFVGTARLTYTVRDATGDPAREVTGRVAVAVRGVPAAPAVPPTVVDSGDGFVALRLAAPVDNGAAVTGYELEDADGGTYSCTTDVCQVTGLDNGTEYRFRFRGVNEVGKGDWSGFSSAATPDVVPEAPDAPVAVFKAGGAGGVISVSWTAPVNRGTPIRDYVLDISPPGSSGPQLTVSGTSVDVRGLTNGTAYVFTVSARNSLGAGPTSAASAPETPAGVPSTPAAPSAKPTGKSAGGKLEVSWTAPAGNGAAVTSYTLRVIRAGRVVSTSSTSATTVEVDADNGVDYQFSVAATNRSGTSAYSPASATVRPFRAPSAPSGLRATPGDGSAALTYTPPDDGGQAIDHYEYQVGSGGWRQLSSNTVTGLANGTQVSISVRACNTYCGDGSSSVSVTPYGPMGAPDVSTDNPNGQNVSFSWSAPRTNGRPAARTEFSINGGAWQTASASGGSWVSPEKYNTTYRIRVRGVDTAGQIGSEATASNSSQTSFLEVHAGDRANSGKCTSVHCRWVVIELYNFDPGDHSCQLHSANGTNDFLPGTTGGEHVTANDVGRGTGENTWLYGYPNSPVWATCDGFTSPQYTWPN